MVAPRTHTWQRETIQAPAQDVRPNGKQCTEVWVDYKAAAILLLKIKSHFKRNFRSTLLENKKTDYKFSKFTFDSKLRQLIFNNGKPVTLSPKESDLLQLLIENINDLTSREEALIKIWKDDNYFTSRSMDVYITKIRKYLSKDSSIKIDNIHGKGFKLSI